MNLSYKLKPLKTRKNKSNQKNLKLKKTNKLSISSQKGGLGSRQIIAVGDAVGNVKLLNKDTGRKFKKFDTQSPVSCLSFSSNYQFLASGHENGEIYIWEFNNEPKPTKKPLYINKKSKINSVSWRYNSVILASTSDDGIIRIWNTLTQECIKEFQKASFKRNCISWSKFGEKIAIVFNKDNEASLLEIYNFNIIDNTNFTFKIEGTPTDIRSSKTNNINNYNNIISILYFKNPLDISDTSDEILAIMSEDKLIFYNNLGFNSEIIFSGSDNSAMVITKDNKYIIIAFEKSIGIINVSDVITNIPTKTKLIVPRYVSIGSEKIIYSIETNKNKSDDPNENKETNNILYINLGTSILLWTINDEHNYNQKKIMIKNNIKTLVWGIINKQELKLKLQLHQLKNPLSSPERTPSPRTSTTSSTARTSSSSARTSTTSPSTITTSPSTSTARRSTSSPSAITTSLSTIRTSYKIATGSADKTLKIWELNNNVLNIFNEIFFKKEVTLVAFSNNGLYLACYSDFLYIYNPNNVMLISTIRNYVNKITSIAFYQKNNNIIITGHQYGYVSIWNIETGSLINTICTHNYKNRNDCTYNPSNKASPNSIVSISVFDIYIAVALEDKVFIYTIKDNNKLEEYKKYENEKNITKIILFNDHLNIFKKNNFDNYRYQSNTNTEKIPLSLNNSEKTVIDAIFKKNYKFLIVNNGSHIFSQKITNNNDDNYNNKKFEIQTSEKNVWCHSIVLSPSEDEIIAGYENGDIIIYNSYNGSLINTIKNAHFDIINSISSVNPENIYVNLMKTPISGLFHYYLRSKEDLFYNENNGNLSLKNENYDKTLRQKRYVNLLILNNKTKNLKAIFTGTNKNKNEDQSSLLLFNSPNPNNNKSKLNEQIKIFKRLLQTDNLQLIIKKIITEYLFFNNDTKKTFDDFKNHITTISGEIYKNIILQDFFSETKKFSNKRLIFYIILFKLFDFVICEKENIFINPGEIPDNLIIELNKSIVKELNRIKSEELNRIKSKESGNKSRNKSKKLSPNKTPLKKQLQLSTCKKSRIGLIFGNSKYEECMLDNIRDIIISNITKENIEQYSNFNLKTLTENIKIPQILIKLLIEKINGDEYNEYISFLNNLLFIKKLSKNIIEKVRLLFKTISDKVTAVQGNT